jgi:hypothetical protein
MVNVFWVTFTQLSVKFLEIFDLSHKLLVLKLQSLKILFGLLIGLDQFFKTLILLVEFLYMDFQPFKLLLL